MEASKIARSYNMQGWRAHLVCETASLNNALLAFHSQRPDDRPDDCNTLEFEIPTSSGFAWQFVRCTLGRPLLSFSTSSGNQTICITRRFLDYQNVTLRRKPGSTSAYVEAITASGKNGSLSLFHEFETDACKGLYEPGKRVRFEIDKGRSNFSIGYPGREPLERHHEFELHFDALPPSERYVSLHEVDPLTGSEWLLRPLRFYPRASESPTHSISYIAWDEDSNGSHVSLPLTCADGAVERMQTYATNASYMNTYVSIYSIPAEGYRLSDFYSLSMLLHPRSTDGCTGAEQIEDVVCGLFENRSRAAVAVEADTLQISGVRPLVKMVSASEPYKETLTPPAEASMQEPVWIDYVPTGNLTFPHYSTYVVLNRAPTHDFKLSKSGDKLKLALTYLDANGLEREIDPRTTEWNILAGGGSISVDGVFTPSSFNRFAVVLAVEPDPKHVFWAVLIVPIPLMSVDDFLKLANRG
ncbi:hypothetical protein [Pseudomonas putida]|uniref:hypothetical protein n=1 Tax=Pseudomonas putida TaxID=303 RepID=UPI00178CA635|nr:hypothetical protein [Pseudomonas putida]